MPRISVDAEAHGILKDVKDRIEERGRDGVDFSDVIRELNNGMVVEDWDFSTDTTCELCNEEPTEDWQMAKINGKWICLQCLGRIVSGI